MPGRCVSNDNWLVTPEYCQWVARVQGDCQKAHCKLCLKDLAKMGECALKSHAKGAKHIQLLKMRHSDLGVLRIRDVLISASTLQKRSSANDEHEESSSQSVSASHIVTTSEVFSSELLWAIQTTTPRLTLASVLRSQ